jgi:hypothetical protein
MLIYDANVTMLKDLQKELNLSDKFVSIKINSLINQLKSVKYYSLSINLDDYFLFDAGLNDYVLTPKGYLLFVMSIGGPKGLSFILQLLDDITMLGVLKD